VNSHQVFQWRRAFKRGELEEPDAATTALLSVALSSPREPIKETPQADAKEQPAACGAIHIEFPARVMISVECGADPVLLRSILESLRK
jgi:transposase-like protein